MTNKNKITYQIEQGALTMPNIPALKARLPKTTYSAIERKFSAMWKAYIAKGRDTPISLPYWAKQINDPVAMNQALKALSNGNWITSIALPNNNWAEAYINESKLLDYVTQSVLEHVRSFHKFSDFMLKMEEESIHANITKRGSSKSNTGLSRTGFMREGNVPFEFDTKKLSEYSDATIELVNKGITKMAKQYPQINLDHANYGEVAKEVVNHYLYNPSTYTSGPRTNDPRGRNNSGYLDKIGNPVGYKIMRAMITIPVEYRQLATTKGINNAYLFIAELHGFKKGTKAEKVDFGRSKYYKSELTEPTELDDIYEDVWLERLYIELDNIFDLSRHHFARITRNRYTKDLITLSQAKEVIESKIVRHLWSTAIEIDMSASVLGYIGALLNHKPFMARCNMIGDTLGDAWSHDTITNRDQFKTIMR